MLMCICKLGSIMTINHRAYDNRIVTAAYICIFETHEPGYKDVPPIFV